MSRTSHVIAYPKSTRSRDGRRNAIARLRGSRRSWTTSLRAIARRRGIRNPREATRSVTGDASRSAHAGDEDVLERGDDRRDTARRDPARGEEPLHVLGPGGRI